MSSEDRRSRIMKLARERGIVRIGDLVGDFEVSAKTIRRDLSVLADRRLLEKIPGGGALPRVTRSADAPGARIVGELVPTHEQASIGIVIPGSNYYFPAVEAGARAVFEGAGVRRGLAVSNYNPDHDEALVRHLLAAGSSGLLLVPNVSLNDDGERQFEWLFELPVPIVLMERTARSAYRDRSLCSVRSDHASGCEAAVRHLVQLGHRGIALVTRDGSQTEERVVAAWRRAVEVAGVDADSSPLIVSPNANVKPTADSWPESETMDEILDELSCKRATAIIAHGDHVSLALLHYARARGWRVPADLSLITYDDELAEMADPPLTAVAPPKHWVGRTAAQLLLDLVSGEVSRPIQHTKIAPTLVIRESTGPPRKT